VEQDKSLDMALAQIERQFGKGAVMKLNGAAIQQIKAIPTGALALDLALGIGGLPRGRVVEIFGPESSGKCLTADTHLWSDVGLETVGELFARLGQSAERASRVTDVVEQGVRVVNERGELELVVALTHNNLRPVIEITTASGRSVKVTGNHPLRVLDRDGGLVWRDARDITVGDTLVSAAFGAEEAGGGGDLAEDEAVLLGYLATSFSPDGEPEVVPEVSEILAGLMGVEPEPGAAEYLLPDVATRAMLAEVYGFSRLAVDPGVPHCVRVAGAKAQRAFLSALFDGCGGVDAAGSVFFETYAEAMARQVQLMLYGFGIPASLAHELDDELTLWKVAVDPAVTSRFLVEIGFRSQRHHGRAAGARPVAGDSHLAVVDVEDLAGRRYTCEPVTAVRDAGYEATFDIVVPASHSFVANGMLSHNTTLALHVVAEAQRNGGVAAFIDAEHALDPSYARALGVDIDELYISQPDTGEQALEIADMLIRSGALDVVVIDSVAALVPRAELEGDMGDTHVGLQARLMSQALRKLAGTINRSETTAIFINQLREKIGVMFGCLQYSTRVTLADGSQEKIGKIVNQRMDVEVLAVDPETGIASPRRVVNWFDNGKADRFLQFTVYKPEGNGRSQFAVTDLHAIATPQGWRQARELAVGDTVLMPLPHYLSDQQWQLVLGGLMGDGSVSPKQVGKCGVTMKSRFRFGHGPKQDAYARWKASLLEGVPVTISPHAKGGLMVETTPLVEFDALREAVYLAGKKVFSWDYLKELTPFALAIWYLDDGTFAERRKDGSAGRSEIVVEAMESSTRHRLLELLRDTYGLSVKLTDRAGKAVLVFDRDGTEAFHELIAPYVPACMEYKLLRHLRDRSVVTPEPASKELRLVPVPIIDIHEKPPTRSMHKFDIEVEGHHNYLADGVMVHNSPETTPGGRALKFYSSVRIDVRRIESIKQGTDNVGNRVRAKIVKNKVAPPFRVAEFDIMFGSGISREGSLIDVAVEHGIVKKSGAWYTFDGDQLGQGREKAKEFLRDNAEIAVQLQDRVLRTVGVVAESSDDEPTTDDNPADRESLDVED
jgi:recombination protein RecA